MVMPNELTPEQQLFFNKLINKSDLQSSVRSVGENGQTINSRIDDIEKQIKTLGTSRSKLISNMSQIEKLLDYNDKNVEKQSLSIKKFFINFGDKLKSLGRSTNVIQNTLDEYTISYNEDLDTSKSLLQSSFGTFHKQVLHAKKLNVINEEIAKKTFSGFKKVMRFPITITKHTWQFLNIHFGSGSSFKKLLSYQPFSIRSTMKTFFTIATKPVVWILNVGAKAIKAIWKSVKLIFIDVPYTAIKKAVDVAGKGIKFLMKFAADLFLNIFRFPWILFIGIPFLIFVLPKILSAVWKVLSTSAKLIWNIIDEYLHISEIWNDILWPGIQHFWVWLTGEKIEDWWVSTKTKIGDMIYKSMSFIFGKHNVDKLIYESKNLWIWIALQFENVKVLYDVTNSVFTILASGLLYYHVKKLIVRTVTFLAKVSGFLIRWSAKIISGAFRGLRYIISHTISGIFKLIKTRIPNIIRRTFGVIKVVIGNTIRKIFTSLGLKIGAKLAIRGALRTIPIIGWVVGAFMDIYEIGKALYHSYKLFQARSDARQSAIEHGQHRAADVIQEKNALASVLMGDYHVKPKFQTYASNLQKLGMTQKQTTSLLRSTAVSDALELSALQFSGIFANIKNSTKRDSASENDEINIASWLSTKFAKVYELMKLYNRSGRGAFSLDTLQKMITTTESAMKTTWAQWVKLQTLAQSGINSTWFNTPGFVKNIEETFKSYNDVIAMSKSYLKLREYEEKEKMEQYVSSQTSNSLTNSEAFIDQNMLKMLNHYSDRVLPLLPPEKHDNAKRKMLKAIQYAWHVGPDAKDYVQASIQHHIDDPAASQEIMKMFDNLSIMYAMQDSVPLYVPKSISQKEIKEFANGGVIVPHETKNVVLPLNNNSQEYIRKQIENVNAPIIKKLKSEYNDITIIEQNISTHETYELYAIEKISKGILGVC